MKYQMRLVAAALMAPLLTLRAQEASSAEAIARGKAVYEGKSGGALCFSCHGMNAKGMPGVGPDLTDGKWLHADGTVASIAAVIQAGVPKPKQSAAAMPPMGGARLDSTQVHAVATYIRSLNKP